MSRHLVACALALAVFSSSSRSVTGHWSRDLLSETLICDEDRSNPLNQWIRTSVPDATGGVLVPFAEFGYMGADPSIRVQRLDGDGIRRWGSCGVVAWSALHTESVGVSDGQGGIILASTDGTQILVRRLDARGIAQWTGTLNSSCTAEVHKLSASPDGQGGIFVAWMGDLDTTTTAYVQRVSAKGAIQWPGCGALLASDVNSYGTGEGDYVLLAPDTQGGVITLTRRSPSRLVAQRISSIGTLAWGAGVTVSSDALRGALVADGAGGAYLTYIQWELNQPTIRVQHLSSSGITLWGVNGLAAGGENPTRGQEAVLCAEAAGGLIVAWNHSPGTGSQECRAQRFSGGGNFLWPAGGVLLSGISGWRPQIISDEAGGAIVGWETPGRQPGQLNSALEEQSVVVQRVDLSGLLVYGQNGKTLPRNAYLWNLVQDGRGGAIVAFSGRDYHIVDLMARRITWSGAYGTEAGSNIAVAQKVHVAGAGTGWQDVVVDYQSGDVWVTPYSDTSGQAPYDLAPSGWTGVYHYDYAAARFTAAVYEGKHSL